MSISLEEALEIIGREVRPLPERSVPLGEALGCTAAAELRSPMAQPPFPRSPYDGYALRAQDSAGACKERPVSLRVVGRSYAGVPANVAVQKGEAVRIMTGGVIPQGADCTMMQEHTDEGEELVQIYEELKPFANYCRAGEDFDVGEKLIAAGSSLNAPALAVAASAGCKELAVIPMPRAFIISTGDELVRAGQPLAPGKIYSSNSVMLCSRLAELGVPVAGEVIVSDELDAIAGSIAKAAESADVVITTGGVSVGVKDLVPAALEKLGAKMLFHGVGIKPGMPTALALYNGKPVLALSGNPFASAAAFELLGRPLLAGLAANVRLAPPLETAALAEPFDYHRSMRRFHRGFVADGVVYIPKAQGNGQLKTMVGCNCLVELPAGEGALATGSTVKLYMLDTRRY